MFALVIPLSVRAAPYRGQKTPFPVLSGIEDAVQFWKQVFTRFSSSEVIFFDPLDLGKIYSVLRIPDNEAGRSMIEKERSRIVADYDLSDEDRVRSQRGAKEPFLAGLKVSGRYLAQMQKIFREAGLPAELAYLPLVESSFNVRARSSVGAVGIWQFTTDTGKKFLRISDAVDERRDPLASTRAAARLLSENYRLLGDWPLAITAYNHGTEGLFRGINEVGSRNLMDLIQRYQSPTFGFASKNFYAEFLAAVGVATNSEAYFPFLRSHPPIALREVEIKRPVPVESLLKAAGISQSDFFEWNPALNPMNKNFPSGYRIKLPPENVARFVAAQRRGGEPAPARRSTMRPRRTKLGSRVQRRPAHSSLTASVKTKRAPVRVVRHSKGSIPAPIHVDRQRAKRSLAMTASSTR
jgi:membrane-bound lytic murein transglycosylase D